MVRTTVMLPAELKAKTMRLARALGVSFGELVRTTLEQAVDRQKRGTGKDEKDPVFVWKTFSGEGPTDIALNHDKYLYEILSEEHDR